MHDTTRDEDSKDNVINNINEYFDLDNLELSDLDEKM